MNTSEKFLRFAAECEFMAEFTHNPENKTVWSEMAERWIHCAELLIANAPVVPPSNIETRSQLGSLRLAKQRPKMNGRRGSWQT